MDSYLINWSYSGYCFSSTFVRFIDSHWQSALEYCSPWLRTRLKGWQPLDDRDKRPLKTPVRLGSEPWSARRTSSSLKCDCSAREREKKKGKDDIEESVVLTFSTYSWGNIFLVLYFYLFYRLSEKISVGKFACYCINVKQISTV